MPIPQRSFLLPVRMLLAAVSVAVISGCATSYPSGSTQQQARYVLNNDAATLLENESLNNFLSQAPASGILNVARSPWGDNVEIVADESYLAASGRECRKLRVIAAGGSANSALVCATPNGWVNQRVVTQAGTQTVEGRY
ncbi:hypothetical protein JNO04_06210 [Halomonas sp. MC140]|nr:DVU3141 family protein [Halomonas sp. MC140]MDN7131944.1 hypothetical protein [Halomonas sp. MC140]